MTKIKLIILFLIFVLNIKAQTNIYHGFPTSNAVWRENSYGYQCSCCSDYQYIISGDTIINGHTYHKIYKSGVKYSDLPSGYCTNNIIGYFNDYFGAYRNDVLNKKVFGIRYNFNNDTLLYDFNLSLGDTLPISSLNVPGYFNHVTNIDSILIGNDYHKRYEISCSEVGSYVYLIEGIGSTFGLFALLMPVFELNSTLLCFNQDGQTVYPDTSYLCELITNNENIKHNDFLFNIFPNPVSTTAQVQLISNYKSLDLFIYNTLGVELLTLKNINSETIINKGNLSFGLYFFKVISNNTIVYKGKFIIE